jgi:hypothetical protein
MPTHQLATNTQVHQTKLLEKNIKGAKRHAKCSKVVCNSKQVTKSYGKKRPMQKLIFYHIPSTSSIGLLQLMDSMCDGSQL